eukprot:6342987-Amphidinium_carterae.1
MPSITDSAKFVHLITVHYKTGKCDTNQIQSDLSVVEAHLPSMTHLWCQHETSLDGCHRHTVWVGLITS